MPVERTENSVKITTDSGTVTVVGTLQMEDQTFQTKEELDAAMKDWLSDCACRLSPNGRTEEELLSYLAESFDLEEMPPCDIELKNYWAGVVENQFPQTLSHRPGPFRFEMTDEEMEAWEGETQARRREALEASVSDCGVRLYGFRVLDTHRNKPLIEEDRKKWWDRWGKDHLPEEQMKEPRNEPEGCFFLCFGEDFCEGSGSGFGGPALNARAIRFFGVTQKDLDEKTDRLLAYASCLSEAGELPGIKEYPV